MTALKIIVFCCAFLISFSDSTPIPSQFEPGTLDLLDRAQQIERDIMMEFNRLEPTLLKMLSTARRMGLELKNYREEQRRMKNINQ